MTELETKLLAALKLVKRVIEGAGYPVDSAIDHAIAEAEIAPQPSADGWIPWAGGECPVANGTLVDVRYRSGRENYELPANEIDDRFSNDASYCFWHHDGMGNDIVAYRVVKEAQQ